MPAKLQAMRVLFPLLLCSALCAQTPAHATLLNGTSTFKGPMLLQTDDVVHAFGSSVFSAYYCRSADGGRTWPVVDQLLGPFRLDALAHDGSLLVAYGARPLGLGQAGVAVAISDDLGATWSPMQIVTTSPVSASDMEVRAHVVGQTIVLLWTEPAIGAVWARRSTDGGLTWPGANVRVGQQPPPPFSSYPLDLHIVGDGTTLHVFWRAVVGGAFRGVMQTTADAGVTWLPSYRLTVPPAVAGPTTVAGDATTLLLSHNGSQLHRSTDGGASWNPVPGLAMGITDHVAVDGSTVVAVGRVDGSYDPTWVIEVSPDGGATWPNAPFVAASFVGFQPEAQIVGNDLYVDFANDLQPSASVVVRSQDAGLTWQAVQSDVSAFSAGPRRNIHVRREPLPQFSGFYLSYAYVGLGWSLAGNGTAGTGGATPRLAMQGLPALGQTAAITVDNARGGALGVLGVSSQPPLATPFAGGTLWLQGQLVTVALLTGGAVGAPGAGSWSLPVAVPNTPALVGAGLAGQAIVLDPAAMAGLALSNAIEIWLR